MSKAISCIIVDDEAVAREIIATHISKIENIKVVAECKNAIEAFNYINNNKVDLIFLDINMPEISGISFAKSISKNIKIIFTTAYRNYAVEGFDLQAVDYLLKPIAFERLLKAVQNYFEVYFKPSVNHPNNKDEVNFIFVRSDRKMMKIEFESIVYIESYSDYIKIHTTKDTIITRETISALESKLPKNNFLRIHRSFIVNLNKIASFTNEVITIENKALTISRSYKQNVLAVLENFGL